MNYPQRLKNIVKWILDILFPVKCIFCSYISKNSEYVCRKCFKTLRIKKDFECIGCGRYVSLGRTCSKCLGKSQIDNLFIATDYKNPSIQKIIKEYKYRFIVDISKPIGDLAAKYMQRIINKNEVNILKTSPLLVPVPLAKYRFNWRGFNQAELICKELCQKIRFRIGTKLLVRDNSRPQADLTNNEDRKNNVYGKFKFVGNNLNGQDILLIDDICTTGSTLNECAKVLKANGAGKVMALVIARG